MDVIIAANFNRLLGDSTGSAVFPEFAPLHQAEFTVRSTGILIEHDVDHAFATQTAQRSEKAGLTEMDFVTLAIMLGAISPVCLKGSKLEAITFNASTLTTGITGNVCDRFSRQNNNMLHNQHLQRRHRPCPATSSMCLQTAPAS
ncbi:hypothetical protein N619_06340 [Ectopseudomonas oleovorans]|nr:hypothetical protein N619_06340 [Pseudomonas oleovorans]